MAQGGSEVLRVVAAPVEEDYGVGGCWVDGYGGDFHFLFGDSGDGEYGHFVVT